MDSKLPKTLVVEKVDRAEPSYRAVRPNKVLNITLGIIVGLAMGVGLAFFIEYLDTSVKTIDDVERSLQAPVLGVIPQNIRLLINESPESPDAEAYRVLKPNGRLEVDDMVFGGPILPTARFSAQGWAECISGALPEQEYIDLVKQAGFRDVTVRRSTSAGVASGVPVYSIQVSAKK